MSGVVRGRGHAVVELRLGPPVEAWPMEMAALHRRVPVGDRVLVVPAVGTALRDGEPSRGDLLEGAGFSRGAGRGGGAVLATRHRSIPDTVAIGMRLLVCGLNPSEYAADAGVGYARPGNRFWPAARRAGLVDVDRDPDAALRDHGLGMTDLVKRTTPGADELTTHEYRRGLARVERLVGWLRPAAVCFVGLAGIRAAWGRAVHAGVQSERLGGRPVYVMPSTSGRNAHASLDDLADHLASASRAALAS